MGGSGFRDRTLAIKSRKTPENISFGSFPKLVKRRRRRAKVNDYNGQYEK